MDHARHSVVRHGCTVALATGAATPGEEGSGTLPFLIIGISSSLPFAVGFNADYGTGTLDGLAYLDTTHPGDAAAVAFLRNLTGNETIVEAKAGIIRIIPGSRRSPVSPGLSACRSTNLCGEAMIPAGSTPGLQISGQSMNNRIRRSAS